MAMPMEEQFIPGPIDFNTLMAMRNAARGQTSLQGAASRRLSQQQGSSQEILPGKTPDQLILEDMEREQAESMELPDIPQDAATTMMRLGAIQQYLRAARGDVVDG